MPATPPPPKPLPSPTVRETLTEELRTTLIPLRAIARATGIDVSTLSRASRSTRTLSGDAIDRLAAYFQLVLTPNRTRRSRARRQSRTKR